AIPFGAVAGDAVRHRLRRLLRDGPVQAEVVAVSPAQEGADRLARHLAEEVPAGQVEAGLDVRVPFEGGVHAAVELRDLERVLAEQVWGQLGETGADAAGVGRKVERAERTDLAEARDPGVGLDLNHGAVEDRDRFTA